MSKHFRSSAAFFTGALLLIAMPFGSGQAQDPNNVEQFMQAKLVHAQKVLESLATEDYGKLEKHAQELDLLSKAATWQVLQTMEYRQHSNDFQRSAHALKDAAKNKNLDGAALAYVDMTLKCVNCHKYVRRVRTAFNAPSLKTWLAQDAR